MNTDRAHNCKSHNPAAMHSVYTMTSDCIPKKSNDGPPPLTQPLHHAKVLAGHPSGVAILGPHCRPDCASSPLPSRNSAQSSLRLAPRAGPFRRLRPALVERPAPLATRGPTPLPLRYSPSLYIAITPCTSDFAPPLILLWSVARISESNSLLPRDWQRRLPIFSTEELS